MSFLYLSEQSQTYAENNLFSCSLGLMNSHLHLNCSINMHDKSMRYYKTDQQLLEALDLTTKLKRHAFARIQQHAHYRRESAGEAYFVPEELAKGNDRIIPAFLNRLKQQKVDSYIKLKLHHYKNSFRTRMRMKSILSKIVSRRLVAALQAILFEAESLPPDANILDGLVTEASQPTVPRKRPKTGRQIEISYTRICSNPELRPSRKTKSADHSRANRHLGEVGSQPRSKRYLFESVDSVWRRIKL